MNIRYILVVFVVSMIFGTLFLLANQMQNQRNKKIKNRYMTSSALMKQLPSFSKYVEISSESSQLNCPFRKSGSFLDFITNKETRYVDNLTECKLRSVRLRSNSK